VNTNAIISKIVTPASDPNDADDKEFGDVKLDKLDKIVNSDAKPRMIAILSKISAIIAYNDPDRKSCSALTSELDIFHQINLY
jgi:hypothetical protein